MLTRDPIDEAVRTVERWGLLAAVTGIVSNGLLLALYTVAQRNSSYEWTGPANDVSGGMALIVALSAALVTGQIPFAVSGAGAGIAVVALFGWVLVVGRTGRATGRLPRRLGRAAEVIGTAALAATPLIGLSLLLPASSIPQYLVGGVGLLLGVPAAAAFPIWLLLLSNRLRGHLADRAARAPELSTVV